MSAHSKEEVRGRVMQKENIDAARSQYGFLEIKRSKRRGEPVRLEHSILLKHNTLLFKLFRFQEVEIDSAR